MRILSRFQPLFPGRNYSAAQNIPVSAQFSGQNTSTTAKRPENTPIFRTKHIGPLNMSRFLPHFQDKITPQPKISWFTSHFQDKTHLQPKNIPVFALFLGQNTPTTQKHPGFRPISGTKHIDNQKHPGFHPISWTKCHPHRTGYGCNKKRMLQTEHPLSCTYSFLQLFVSYS